MVGRRSGRPARRTRRKRKNIITFARYSPPVTAKSYRNAVVPVRSTGAGAGFPVCWMSAGDVVGLLLAAMPGGPSRNRPENLRNLVG